MSSPWVVLTEEIVVKCLVLMEETVVPVLSGS